MLIKLAGDNVFHFKTMCSVISIIMCSFMCSIIMCSYVILAFFRVN